MGRVTVKQLKQQVTLLLELKDLYDEYKSLEQEIKAGMVAIGYKEIKVDQGRVFISQSERVSVPPVVARDVLGTELAEKVIRIKESVPNELLRAMVEIGDISEGQRDQLLAKAERKPVVSLYVRPLK